MVLIPFSVFADEQYTLITSSEDNSEFTINNTQFYASTGYNSFNRLQVYNCSSDSSCTGSTNFSQYTGGNVFDHTMANYGYDFAHDTNIAIGKNHLISYEYVLCYQNGISSLTNDIYVNGGVGSARGTKVSLLKSDYYSISNIFWNDLDNGFTSSSCYVVYNIFTNTDSTWTIKTNVRTSSYTHKNVNIVGYKISDLGATDYLTQSQLQSSINNSGLASASSVNQVQQSVNQVQSEINGVNDSIQEQIDADTQNTQDIINNQNANNQALQDNIDKQFNTCYTNPTYVNSINYAIINEYNSTLSKLDVSSSNLKVFIFDAGTAKSVSFKLTNGNRLRLATSDNLYTSANGQYLNRIVIENNPTLNSVYTYNISNRYLYFYIANSNISVDYSDIVFSSDTICTNRIDETNSKLDDINNADISDDVKSLPDSSSFDDYHTAENSLKDKIKEADMSVLDIGIDSNSSNWVWNTLTSLIQSHSAIFGMFISILSIGIIKMALGR